MGTDIHQWAMIWNEETGDYFLEGEGIGSHLSKYRYNDEWYEKQKDTTKDIIKLFDESYHANLVPEICPGRCYAFFGVISGVREDHGYQITDTRRHEGYPEFMDPDILAKIKNWRHSPCYFYFPDFEDAMKDRAMMLSSDIEKYRIQQEKQRELIERNKELGIEADYWDYLDHIRDLRGLRYNVRYALKRIRVVKKVISKASYKKSILILNFDS